MDVSIITQDISDCFREKDCQTFSGKSVLITGASGLIGTYLCAYFVSLQQRGVDLKLYAITYSELPNYLSDLFNLGRVKHLRLNLECATEYGKLPIVDYAIHAAGYAQPMIFMQNPVATLGVNVSATLALLKRINKGGRFVFLSSSEVYCGLEGECIEDMCGTSTPAHPRASYIEGKRSGETACFSYRDGEIHASAARLGDIYGPGTRSGDKRALNSFIEQALNNKEVRLRDGGDAIRSYCYVTDAVRMLLAILTDGKEVVYNVGSPFVSSILELAKLISQLTGSKLTVPTHSESISGAPEALKINLKRISDEFNISDYVDLEEGLRRTILWQRGLYQESKKHVT